MKLESDDEWVDGAAANLEFEVGAKRIVREGRDSGPIWVRCVGQGSLQGVAAGLVVKSVRARLERSSDVSLRPLNSSLRMSIQVSGDATRVEISGGSPKILHYPRLSLDPPMSVVF